MKTLITLAAKSAYIIMLIICAAFLLNLAYNLYLGEYAQAAIITIIGTLFCLLTHSVRNELWTA